MTSFCGWVSTASRLELLRGSSLLFTTKFQEIPGTHFNDLGRSLSQPWSHPVVLNMGPLDWESNALTTRLLLHMFSFFLIALIITWFSLFRLKLKWLKNSGAKVFIFSRIFLKIIILSLKYQSDTVFSAFFSLDQNSMKLEKNDHTLSKNKPCLNQVKLRFCNRWGF